MRIKCLKIEQPIGTFYLATVSSAFLKDVYFTKSARYDGGGMVGGQRDASKKSLDEISDYVKTENAAIPNGLILAANYTEEDDFVIEPTERWELLHFLF